MCVLGGGDVFDLAGWHVGSGWGADGEVVAIGEATGHLLAVEFAADGRHLREVSGDGELGGLGGGGRVQGTWGSWLPNQKQSGLVAGLAWRRRRGRKDVGLGGAKAAARNWRRESGIRNCVRLTACDN